MNMEQVTAETKAWVVSEELRSQYEGLYTDQKWYNLSIKKEWLQQINQIYKNKVHNDTKKKNH